MVGREVGGATRMAPSTTPASSSAERTAARNQRRRVRAAEGPRFAHESEAELARILDFYQVRWEYEPRTFPVLWNLDGQVVESFSPDFYLPDVDLWVELTTLRQSLVRKKNRKLRRMRELYPMVRLKLLYARDFRALMLKYGRMDLAASFIGIDGQVMPGPDTVGVGASTPDVARSDPAASTPDDDLEP
jgi:bifunctional protein TilS/HprT